MVAGLNSHLTSPELPGNVTCMPIIFLFLIVALSSTVHAEKNLLIVTDEWPPYVIDDPVLPGVDGETALAVLQKMGYTPKLEFVPWKRAVTMTKQGSADALLDVGHNKKREAFLYFPLEPINRSVTTFFCIDCQADVLPTLNKLRGKTIAVNRGYAYKGDFDEDKDIRKIEVNTFLQGFELLVKKRVDYYPVNRLVGQYIIHKHDIKNIGPIKDNLSENNPIFLAFSKQKNHEQLSLEFGRALEQFKASPTYSHILQKYGLKPH